MCDEAEETHVLLEENLGILRSLLLKAAHVRVGANLTLPVHVPVRQQLCLRGGAS